MKFSILFMGMNERRTNERNFVVLFIGMEGNTNTELGFIDKANYEKSKIIGLNGNLSLLDDRGGG